ncbi:MAG: hypothetical protein ACOYEH_03810 [Caldicoprobacterales bacterium]
MVTCGIDYVNYPGECNLCQKWRRNSEGIVSDQAGLQGQPVR